MFSCGINMTDSDLEWVVGGVDEKAYKVSAENNVLKVTMEDREDKLVDVVPIINTVS